MFCRAFRILFFKNLHSRLDHISYFSWSISSKVGLLLLWIVGARVKTCFFLFSDMGRVCAWLVGVCALSVLSESADTSLETGDHAHLDHQHTHLVPTSNAASGKKSSRCVCFLVAFKHHHDVRSVVLFFRIQPFFSPSCWNPNIVACKCWVNFVELQLLRLWLTDRIQTTESLCECGCLCVCK